MAKRTFGAALLAFASSLAPWFARAEDAPPSIRPTVGPLQISGLFAFQSMIGQMDRHRHART